MHYAGHGAYTKAVNQALRVAQRVKIPGMTACQKLAVVQDALHPVAQVVVALGLDSLPYLILLFSFNLCGDGGE